jgi:tetratricopeptide (TPR) repeat protein
VDLDPRNVDVIKELGLTYWGLRKYAEAIAMFNRALALEPRSIVDSEGRTIWIADAHRGDGKRFVVRADEKLTAFMQLEAAIRRA